jgi:hypothetical protein
MCAMTPAKLRIGDNARDVPSGVTGGACHFTIARGWLLQHVLKHRLMTVSPSWISFACHHTSICCNEFINVGD